MLRSSVVTLVAGLTAALVQSAAAAEADAAKAWGGSWKIAKPESYHSIEITDVDARGFELSYDEGIGIRGQRFSGRAQWTGKDRARFQGDRCEITLVLGPAQKLTATFSDTCLMDE